MLAFVKAVKSRIQNGLEVGEKIKLVLLGDIFEILKSDEWIDRNVRPWHTSTDLVSKAATTILNGIERTNCQFFDALQDWRIKFGIDLVYLPGNHDGLVADIAIPGLRKRIREIIPGLPGAGDDIFENMLVDFEHGVVAEHGHQLDMFNLPVTGTRFVPGDAVVLEVLVQLPRRTATLLGSQKGAEVRDQFQGRLLFLQELDNVLPQNLSGMMSWLALHMEVLPNAQRRVIEGALSSAIRQCGTQLRVAMKAHGATEFERRMIGALISHKGFTNTIFLRELAMLPIGAADQSGYIVQRLGAYGVMKSVRAQSLDLYIAGHTHATLQQEFVLNAGRRMTYLNTGTWRRVLTPARSLHGTNFQKYYEETVLCVHRIEDSMKLGRYEFLRYVRSG